MDIKDWVETNIKFIKENFGDHAYSVFINAIHYDNNARNVRAWLDIEYDDDLMENLNYGEQLRALKTLSRWVVFPKGCAADIIEQSINEYRLSKGLPT